MSVHLVTDSARVIRSGILWSAICVSVKAWRNMKMCIGETFQVQEAQTVRAASLSDA